MVEIKLIRGIKLIYFMTVEYFKVKKLDRDQ